MMRILLSGLALMAAISTPAFATDREAVPVSGAIEFDVYRGDSRFGTHILRFEEQAGELRVIADVDLRVRIGPITAFRYEHDSVEVYRNGELVSYEGETLKDGERLIVELERANSSAPTRTRHLTGRQKTLFNRIQFERGAWPWHDGPHAMCPEPHTSAIRASSRHTRTQGRARDPLDPLPVPAHHGRRNGG